MIYNSYPEFIEGENDEEFFEFKNYDGRLNIYNIILNYEYTSNCTDINCGLCRKELNDINTYCLTCKYNYSLLRDNNEDYKLCHEKIISYDEPITDIITYDEPITDIITYRETKTDIITYDEPKTDLITNDETKTDIITYNEPITDIITYKEPKTNIITYDEPKTDIA